MLRGLRPKTVIAGAIVGGIAMLVVGALDRRPAVSVTLIVVGALTFLVGVLLAIWADTIEEFSVGRGGITLKRTPAPEELVAAGLPDAAARLIAESLEELRVWVPSEIHRQVRQALADRGAAAKARERLVRDFAARQQQL